ncbi:MAG: ABC transporter ATP-binding protein [Acidobacteriota bacterium]
MKPLLQVERLCAVFPGGALAGAGSVRPVEDVSFEVFPGEALGLVGESGSGKTTLARAVLRLIEPASGRVVFDGVDLTALGSGELRRKRREFQMVFQDPPATLNPRMSLGQIVSEPFAAHGMGTPGERESWVCELMDSVGLDRGLIDRRPPQLSGGQLQRVAIARALALRPRFLVADEPVSALDVSIQAQILNLLADLQRRLQLSLLLITHSLPAAYYLCSRIAVMYLGRLVEVAPSASFFSRPGHPYSRSLLQAVPGLNLQTDGPGSIERASVAAPPPGCRFHPRCPHTASRCRMEVPELVPTPEGGAVACFLHSGNEAASPGEGVEGVTNRTVDSSV